MTDDLSSFGEIFREYRKASGLTQRKVAVLSGLSSSFICDIEKRKKVPSTKTCKSLADAIGVPLSKLLDSPRRQEVDMSNEELFTAISISLSTAMMQLVVLQDRMTS